MNRYFGHYFRILHSITGQAVTNALASMDLTAAQGQILGYILHAPEPPCSRDIEEAFRLTHPTVSGLLSRLEKKGFIEFRPDEKDRRCKRIFPLEKCRQCHCLVRDTINQTESQLLQGFSQEEQELFHSFLQRSIHNMGMGCCNRKSKEDSNQ